jgi:hypothetical protein
MGHGDKYGVAMRDMGRPKRRRRRSLASLLAIACASLVLGGFAAPSFAATVQMGFGVERSGSDWLGLDGNPKSSTVNGYLNHEQATWVNAHVGWTGLVNQSAFPDIETWATQAQTNGKKLLLSIDYHAPTNLQRNDCDLPNPNSTAAGNDAITSMRSAVHNLANDLGPSSAEWTNVRLEIGTEPNQNMDCKQTGIHARDAQLWYDIVNDTARSAANQGWSPGRGIVSGGVFTNNDGDAPFGNDKGSVGAKTWLAAGIDDARAFNWEHYNSTNFDRYGVHTAHCVGLNDRTKWTGCQQDVNDRIGQVWDVLDKHESVATKPIDVTALIPTQAAPDDATRQATQASDSTDIWNGIRTTYGAMAEHPVKLVIWNHLVDTGQTSFPFAGFMACAATAAGDDSCATAPTYNYPKDVYDAAHTWPGVDTG